MMLKFSDNIQEFLPEKPREGRRGFYPCTEKEWHDLPLPMRCSTWDHRVKAVVFNTWLDNYKMSVKVHVHPQHVFKALFCLSQGGTLLSDVVAVEWEGGGCTFAKWLQDTRTGCFGIYTIAGNQLGQQGGHRGHVPENCYKNEAGEWRLNSCYDRAKGICQSAL